MNNISNHNIYKTIQLMRKIGVPGNECSQSEENLFQFFTKEKHFAKDLLFSKRFEVFQNFVLPVLKDGDGSPHLPKVS